MRCCVSFKTNNSTTTTTKKDNKQNERMNEEEGRKKKQNKKCEKKNNNPRQQKNKQTHSFFVCINYSLFHFTIYIVTLHYNECKEKQSIKHVFLVRFFFFK